MKTKTKIFLAVLIGMLVIVCQEYVRRQFGINPQIWVFVAYAMAMAGEQLLLCVFAKELEEKQFLKTENSAFAIFDEDYSVEEEQNKVKKVIKKVLKSRIYKEVDYLMITFLCFLIFYTVFFFEYFMPSPTWAIAESWCAIDAFANAMICTDKIKKSSKRIAGICALFVAKMFL